MPPQVVAYARGCPINVVNPELLRDKQQEVQEGQ